VTNPEFSQSPWQASRLDSSFPFLQAPASEATLPFLMAALQARRQDHHHNLRLRAASNFLWQSQSRNATLVFLFAQDDKMIVNKRTP
jgi:hypothetical protein